MSDRGPNQDLMPIGGQPEGQDATYRDASYLGTSEDDEEEVRDLGFIVDDHDDRRSTLAGDWQRLDDLDTDEPLETNRSGPIPHGVSLREQGAPEEWFATDYHTRHAEAEAQEEDFVETSLLQEDPEMNAGADDFTSESMRDIHGSVTSTDITGAVTGVAYGAGTSLAQDLGSGGFQIRDNPLTDEENLPEADKLMEDEVDGPHDYDEPHADAHAFEGRGEIARAADPTVRLAEDLKKERKR
jgi:hypothetical protein